MKIITPLREITCHMGSHSVACHLTAVTFSSSPQPKVVLDLMTPEGCKAELTLVVVISQDSLPANTLSYLGNNRAVTWMGTEPATKTCKSNVLTTTPQSRLHVFVFTQYILSAVKWHKKYEILRWNLANLTTDQNTYKRNPATTYQIYSGPCNSFVYLEQGTIKKL